MKKPPHQRDVAVAENWCSQFYGHLAPRERAKLAKRIAQRMMDGESVRVAARNATKERS